MNLIILNTGDVHAENLYRLDDYRFEHIHNILKLKKGDSIEIGILNGGIGAGTIDNISESEVIIKSDGFPEEIEFGCNIDLICALPRPQTLKKVLSVSSAMGVRKIYLIRSNRVEKSYFDSPLLEKENIEHHLIEGLMQGKNTRLPKVTIHKRFKPFIQDFLPTISDNSTLKLLADCDAEHSMQTVYNKNGKDLIVAIGPEGDWVPFEINLMHEAGFKSFSLCRWILRVEQAVTSVLAQLELLEKSK